MVGLLPVLAALKGDHPMLGEGPVAQASVVQWCDFATHALASAPRGLPVHPDTKAVLDVWQQAATAAIATVAVLSGERCLAFALALAGDGAGLEQVGGPDGPPAHGGGFCCVAAGVRAYGVVGGAAASRQLSWGFP